MKSLSRTATDDVSWARRVNTRWIVHDDLAENAAAYLAHLEKYDPARLARACAGARELCHNGGVGEDPKPRFYCGLFREALPAEKARFLKRHAFVRAVLAKNATELPISLQHAGEETQAKIFELREALRPPDKAP